MREKMKTEEMKMIFQYKKRMERLVKTKGEEKIKLYAQYSKTTNLFIYNTIILFYFHYNLGKTILEKCMKKISHWDTRYTLVHFTSIIMNIYTFLLYKW